MSTNQKLTRKSKIIDLYRTPVGHDTIEKLGGQGPPFLSFSRGEAVTEGD